MSIVYGNAVGGITGYGKTFILTDENGNELTGVVTGEEVIFTADPTTDIREGKVAATDIGVVTGATTIPNYETSRGNVFITSGAEFKISALSDEHQYTFLQCIITKFNTTVNDSTQAEYVVISDAVYRTNSTEKLCDVSINQDDKTVDFNFTNDTEDIYLIRYVTYKEVA